ncbi:MAG TPA: sulfatase-like hydrolase/transferase [Candidatus Binatia bacterium]|nr:sulfatase-like hydrolase/transferase [Candidatus Binatia bacterium]
MKRLAAALLGVGLAGVVAWRAWERRAEALPARIHIEDVMAELPPPPAGTAHLGTLTPEPAFLDLAGGERPALITAVPRRLTYRLHVPAGAVLRFAAGVQRDAPPTHGAGGVRFAVAVDGVERYARAVDPGRKHDRRWFEERVDLGAGTASDVEIALTTAPARAGAPPGGTPGWSNLRVVTDAWRERQRAGPASPSVLVVLVDALRADRLGCYGAEPSPSPTLDRLAAGGLVFDAAVSQAPWTAPAVATYFTGLNPRSHGVLGAESDEVPGSADHGQAIFLADAHRTLAEEAARAGITTLGVSSNPLVSRGTNFAQGFEVFREFGWDPARRNWADAAEVTAAALDALRAARGRRFLAYVHFMEPHDPYTPDADLRPPAPAGVDPLVAAGQAHALAAAQRRGAPAPGPRDLAYLRALYDAEIRTWDRQLGALLDGLGRLGLRDSTVVVVLADHGEEFEEHGWLTHRVQLYDELIRVPLVIAGPGIPRGRVEAQVQGIDVFPTLAALLGVAVPPGLPGRDALATPRAERPAVAETEFGLGAGGGTTELLALRRPPWKLIWAPASGRHELYDLAHDPGEHHDRFADAPEGAALAAELAGWRATAPSPPRAQGRDPALEQKLRALGYVD